MKRFFQVMGLLVVTGSVLSQSVDDRYSNLFAAQQAESSQDDSSHVYTNDDWPFNTPRARDGAEGNEQNEAKQPEEEGAIDSGTTKSAPRGRVAPFVTTPMEVVSRMLQMAGTGAGDTVYDLGSGDGRIVIEAASRFGARAVGVELNPQLARESAERIQELGLEERARIIQGDLFETDVTTATVVTVYLLQAANRQLSPILEKSLQPGTRVVAHDIRIPDWRPAEEEVIQVGPVRHTIYLYRVPEAFEKSNR